jgi:glycerol-3-phosphate dehydrogenase
VIAGETQHEYGNNPFIEAFKFAVRGIAQLINGKKKGSTAQLARNHVIEKSDSNLVSLMGGKWTSYRAMGEETVDEILHHKLLDEIGHK